MAKIKNDNTDCRDGRRRDDKNSLEDDQRRPSGAIY